MGSISGKCKQCTSCRSAPSTSSSTDRIALVLLGWANSRYQSYAFSGNAKVNRMNFFFPSEKEKRLYDNEMCHKSSAGAKLHATDDYSQGPLSSAPHFPEFWDKDDAHNLARNAQWCLTCPWCAPLGTTPKQRDLLLASCISRLVGTNLTVISSFLPTG